MISFFVFFLFGLVNARDNFTHTVRCNDLKVGETFKHDGKLFTKVNKTMLLDYILHDKYTALETSCTSGIDDMSNLFVDVVSFNQNISTWDTSSVINMQYMFHFAQNFNQDISSWNTSNVKDMRYMFSYAISFNQDISNWDTSNVKDMRGMFYKAVNFVQDISNWNISNVKDMSLMLTGANDVNPNILKFFKKIYIYFPHLGQIN